MKDHKDIKMVTIVIEWKRNPTLGYNPHCTATATYKDGTTETSPVFKASGCGYDKESTVVAEAFTHFLRHRIQRPKVHKEYKEMKTPYGISADKGRERYDGGIGMNCYYRISEYIGGSLRRVTSTDSIDVYEYTQKTWR